MTRSTRVRKTARTAYYWRNVKPRSLRHAIELCVDYALDKHRLTIEGIADRMGIPSHWNLYKYMENGRMPAILIRPFEHACGCTYVTEHIALSASKLIFDIPTGKRPDDKDILELNEAFNDSIKLLSRFYKGAAEAEDTISAITNVMCELARQRENVIKSDAPEFDFSESES